MRVTISAARTSLALVLFVGSSRRNHSSGGPS